jgi:hypothetical protein
MDSGSVLKSGKFTKWIALPMGRMRKYFSNFRDLVDNGGEIVLLLEDFTQNH